VVIVSTSYELEWEGPFYLLKSVGNSFWSSITAKQKGIYAFCWKVDDDDSAFMPHYIGMTENFYERVTQHIKNILNGTYYIYNNGSLNNNKKEYIYNPNQQELEWFLSNYDEIHDVLSEYFKCLGIFMAPSDNIIPSDNITGEELYNIEAKLTKDVYDSEYGHILDSPEPRGKINEAIKSITVTSKGSLGSILPKGF
jgi:hypothetical protein